MKPKIPFEQANLMSGRSLSPDDHVLTAEVGTAVRYAAAAIAAGVTLVAACTPFNLPIPRLGEAVAVRASRRG